MDKKIISNHGDLILYPVNDLNPPEKAVSAKVHVLQASEATGNRHEVASESDDIFRWEDEGKEFIHCASDYVIRHVGGDSEHGIQTVQAGTREVRHEEEYNPWGHELRRVID